MEGALPTSRGHTAPPICQPEALRLDRRSLNQPLSGSTPSANEEALARYYAAAAATVDDGALKEKSRSRGGGGEEQAATAGGRDGQCRLNQKTTRRAQRPER